MQLHPESSGATRIAEIFKAQVRSTPITEGNNPTSTPMVSPSDWTPVTPREKRVMNTPGAWHNPSGALMRELGSDIWVVERGYVDFTGLDIGGKMTIVRLREGRLLIHSALPLTRDLKDAVDALGTVSFIVAPNAHHVDFVGHWKRHYPGAVAIAPPGLKAARKDVPFDDEMDAISGHTAWKDEGIEHVYVGGVPFMNETVFFHRASKTLIVTDIVFSFPSEGVSFWMKLGHSGLAWLFWKIYQWGFVRDRRMLEESLDRIEGWDFETLIPTHGVVVTENAKDVFKRWHGRM